MKPNTINTGTTGNTGATKTAPTGTAGYDKTKTNLGQNPTTPGKTQTPGQGGAPKQNPGQGGQGQTKR